MKKKLLMGILGLIMLFPFGTNAETIDSIEEGNNSLNATVTVGEVDVPVYNVEVSWDPLQFNWEYNSETTKYEWNLKLIEVAELCELATKENTIDLDNLEENEPVPNYHIYPNSKCIFDEAIEETLTYEEIISGNYYIGYGARTLNNVINIKDKSTKSRIYPEIEWKPEEKYGWTTGLFHYEAAYEAACKLISEEEFNNLLNLNSTLYLDSKCQNIDTSNEKVWEEGKWYFSYPGTYLELKSKNIPDEARLSNTNPQTGEKIYYYSMLFSLGIDENKEITTPKAGEAIGTITITIKTTE